jgi:lipoic acid synthetase
VARYVEPAVFDEFARRAHEMGFMHAACGPLVRSSYHAESFFAEANKLNGTGQ